MKRNVRVCPKCRKELTVLGYSQIVRNFQTFRLEKGVAHYEAPGRVDGDDVGEWYCPECDTTLFTNQVDAEKFLQK